MISGPMLSANGTVQVRAPAGVGPGLLAPRRRTEGVPAGSGAGEGRHPNLPVFTLDLVWGIVAWIKSRSPSRGDELMSKGMDRKKEGKKKPAKSLQEKRAAKREKKQNRGFQV